MERARGLTGCHGTGDGALHPSEPFPSPPLGACPLTCKLHITVCPSHCGEWLRQWPGRCEFPSFLPESWVFLHADTPLRRRSHWRRTLSPLLCLCGFTCSILFTEQVPPRGYVTFNSSDENPLEGRGLCFRDVTSPINDRDVESSSSSSRGMYPPPLHAAWRCCASGR